MTDQTRADKLYFYRRNGRYIPRIAAVHDLCGYGKCSLGIAIPVLSAAGIDVCPVPTAFLSSHTRFAPFTFYDTSAELPAYLDAWRAIGVDLDGVYSGFLAAAAQIELIRKIYARYPNAPRLVDPVLGDGGRVYPTCDMALCDAMRTLAQRADLLTPNLTEAAILARMDYQGESPDDGYLDRLIARLRELDARCVVLKGIVRADKIRNYIFGRDVESCWQESELYPLRTHGTGDLFCSALIAALYASRSLYESVQFAAEFVCLAMTDTPLQPQSEERGISFELQLAHVTRLLSEV